MIDIDTKDIKKFQRELKFFGDKLYPRIQGASLNKGAFETMRAYRRGARRKMVLRNKFTERSIQFDKVRGLNPRSQASVVGSIAPYMEDQEFGATISKTGKYGVAIPTGASSGEEGVRPRRKLVRRPNRRGNITLQRRRIKAKSKKQFIVAAIKETAKRGGRNKFVFLPFDRHPGIYKVVGGKRRQRIQLIHDLSRQSVTIQPRRPLKQAVDLIGPRLPRFFVKIANDHLRRFK